jgi:hypothetical protein
MPNRNKFEEMLERLINEDQTGAEELFHDIVVEKSRKIYEDLLAEEYEVEEATEEEDEDEEVEEATEEEDEDEEVSEDFDLDSFEVEAEDPMAAMGGDETDELEMDVEMGDEMDDEAEEELEDRVVDIEDALDELKAEFEKMMSGESDDEEGDDEMDMDDEAGDEEEKESIDPYDQVATMREYVEKVTAKMGDYGVQKQSTVAGKNDMGGTASNIARADTENGGEAGSAGGAMKGSALSDTSAKDMNTGNVNVPGGKASKSLKGQPGHGAEKKGSGETADNKQSTLRARK